MKNEFCFYFSQVHSFKSKIVWEKHQKMDGGVECTKEMEHENLQVLSKKREKKKRRTFSITLQDYAISFEEQTSLFAPFT